MGLLKTIWDNVSGWTEKHPGKTCGLVTVPGDTLMLGSGIVFNNWGRIAGGLAGIIGNAPLLFYGDKHKRGQLEHDAQNERFRSRMAQSWKFWKYPWEFYANVNLGQMAALVFLAGPDTVSHVGELTHKAALISHDAFRFGETISALITTGGFFVIYVHENPDRHPAGRPEGTGRVQYLSGEFMKAARFVRDRARDVADYGWKPSLDNAIDGIATYGPNRLAANMFNTGLIPYAIEAVLRGDKFLVASCAVYYAGNRFLALTSKRAKDMAATTIMPPAVQ